MPYNFFCAYVGTYHLVCAVWIVAIFSSHLQFLLRMELCRQSTPIRRRDQAVVNIFFLIMYHNKYFKVIKLRIIILRGISVAFACFVPVLYCCPANPLSRR